MTNTIQTDAVKHALKKLKHATNQQLHENVRNQFSNISATTVHRITSRLIDNNEIGYAPSNGKGVVLDADPQHHDHFVCKGCGGIKNIVLSLVIFENIQQQLGKDIVENEMVIYGICVECSAKSRTAFI